MRQFGSFEVRAEYAVWAITSGDNATAAKLQAELDQIMKRWNRHTRELNMPLVRRLAAANDVATKRP